MIQDKFFRRVQRWSERKHRLLEKYLSPFSAKVGSWAREIYCIDGFAGAARYGDNKEGSPLLMARLSDKCATWKNPVTLRLINVESKRSHFKSLVRETQPWVDKGIVVNKHGEFGTLIPEILDQIGDRPALFFLDPYGPTKIYYSQLLQILRRPVSATELIINYHGRGLRRLADCLHARSGEKTDARAISKIIDHVTSIMGDDNWKQYFTTATLPPLEREKVLRTEYMKQLHRFNYNVVSYPIRESIERSPKYYLIFCSRHIEGVMLMNRFIREEEDQLLTESAEARLPLFNVAEETELGKAIEMRRMHLRKLILEFAREARRTTRGDIKRRLIPEHFGVFHENDYTAVVQEFVNVGKLQTSHGRKRFNDNEPLTYIP